MLRFYDLNEEAFAYQRQCIAKTESINPTFLKNLEYVANALLDEAVKNDPAANPHYIRTQILERRYNIQYKLEHYYMSHSCSDKEVKRGQDHYEQFSLYNTDEIRKFIEESGQ